jgi:hypothetical protein
LRSRAASAAVPVSAGIVLQLVPNPVLSQFAPRERALIFDIKYQKKVCKFANYALY